MPLSPKQEALIFILAGNRTGVFKTNTLNSRQWYVDPDHCECAVGYCTLQALIRDGYLAITATFISAIDYYQPTEKAYEVFRSLLKPTRVKRFKLARAK